MLTDQQKIELEKLKMECKIPILCSVLNRTIPKWINDEIFPNQKDYGVKSIYNEYGCEVISENNKCCLIGTALITNNPLEDWIFLQEISNKNLISIIRAFDGVILENEEINQEIYDYVTKIRICIFGK